MAHRPYPTAPIKTDRMAPSIPYIVGNEAAERFNFYGMRAILFVFMTKYLVDGSGAPAPMAENEANRWYHLFLSANYFFPTIGAIVSDAFLGQYRTILSVSAGNLFAAAVHWIIANPDGTVKLQGAAYYSFYAAIFIGASVHFVFFALRYHEKIYLQGGATPAAA